MGRVPTIQKPSPLSVTIVACNSNHIRSIENRRVCRKVWRCHGSRSRQELEAEYYKEWERLTLVPEEELNRKMTFMSFITFLPVWLRYHGLPGPVRFLLFSKSKPPSEKDITIDDGHVPVDDKTS